MDELKKANNLTTNSLTVGQLLKIPSGEVEKPSSNTYVVKSGDSLYKIANQFNTTVNELKNLNNLTTNTLQIGQVLKIPSGEVEKPSSNTYVVKSGDNLYKIANQFNTTVNELKNLNNLTTNTLQIGQVLKIPGGEVDKPSTNTYIVKSGDSLYKIANQFGVSVSSIMSANNLSNSNLSIGQKLIIPSGNSNQVYTVKSGDSLYSIAQNFNTSVKAIQDLNNLQSNLLSIGQKLLIP